MELKLLYILAGGFGMKLVNDVTTWFATKVKPEVMSITKELKTELDTEEAKARIAMAKYQTQAHTILTEAKTEVSKVEAEIKSAV